MPGSHGKHDPAGGLGDQATRAFIVAGTTANFRKAPVASAPGASLIVQASNAVIAVHLDTTQTATGLSQTSPPGSAQEAGMVIMARDVLAVLARPAAAVAPPPSSLAAEPRYTGQPDPCRMVRAATLARYAPGPTLSPQDSQVEGKPVPSWASSCAWSSEDFSAQLTVSTYPGAVAAQERFQADEQGLSFSSGAIEVTGMRWVDSLGEGALASVRHQNTEGVVGVIAWAGNAEVNVSYSDLAPGATSPAETARLVAGAIAMAGERADRAGQPGRACSADRAGLRAPGRRVPWLVMGVATLSRRYAPGAARDSQAGSPALAC